MQLESPFLVYRDLQSGEVTSVPFAEFCAMRRQAARLIRDSDQGDPQAKAMIDWISHVVRTPGMPYRGHVIISAHLMNDAIAELNEQKRAWFEWQQSQQAQQQVQGQQAQAQAQPPQQKAPTPEVHVTAAECVHGRPADVPCVLCELERAAAPAPAKPVSTPAQEGRAA